MSCAFIQSLLRLGLGLKLFDPTTKILAVSLGKRPHIWPASHNRLKCTPLLLSLVLYALSSLPVGYLSS